MFNLIISFLAIILVLLTTGVAIYYGAEAFGTNNDKIQKVIKKFNANKTRLPRWKSKQKLA